MLNGIDISPIDQPSIQLNQVPCDFVLVQHSYGRYVHNGFFDQIGSVFALDKKAGIYHYVTGDSREMDTFINGVRPYVGRAIIALDYERTANSEYGNFGYLQDFAQKIIDELHVRPLLYGSADIYEPLLNISHNLNCGLWIAQYATDDPTGYQESPWNEQLYDMAMFQYSSTGRLSGYGENLDLDLFYGDGNTWDAYARPFEIESTVPQHGTVQNTQHTEKAEIMTISTDTVNQFQNTLPAGKKILIYNIKSESMYLTSHDGGPIMSDEPTWWYIQKNEDNTISLADPWGNWLTVPVDPQNGDKLSIVRGNGSLNQRWVAEPYQGGFKLVSYVNACMDLDVPDDIDSNGQKVQIWGEWSNNEYCPNQTWGYKLYVEESEHASTGHTDTKIKHIPADDKTKVETKTDIEHREQKIAIDRKQIEDARTQKIIGDVADTIENDINNGTVMTDANNVADKVSGMIEEALNKKALSRKAVRWVFAIAIVITLACIILSALALSHLLPAWVAGLCAMIIGGTGIGGHALGISATTK